MEMSLRGNRVKNRLAPSTPGQVSNYGHRAMRPEHKEYLSNIPWQRASHLPRWNSY